MARQADVKIPAVTLVCPRSAATPRHVVEHGPDDPDQTDGVLRGISSDSLRSARRFHGRRARNTFDRHRTVGRRLLGGVSDRRRIASYRRPRQYDFSGGRGAAVSQYCGYDPVFVFGVADADAPTPGAIPPVLDDDMVS